MALDANREGQRVSPTEGLSRSLPARLKAGAELRPRYHRNVL